MKFRSLLLIASLVLCAPQLAAANPSMQPGTPPGHPGGGAPSSSAEQALPWEGKVAQTMDGGGYTYVYLEQKNGEKVWLAMPSTKVRTGAQMKFSHGSEMRNFQSTTLNRTFDVIFFSGGPIGDSAGKAGPTGSDGELSPGSTGASSGKTGKIKVDKATGKGACTVEEAHRNKAGLDRKKVLVRGQVVKVSTGIMGKNWVHLQDGTGSQTKGTHNLVVTTKDLPTVGDVITMSGTLAKDKDFGGGYKYDVIVEDAKIKE